MLKQVIFCNREEAEGRAGSGECAVISITEPDSLLYGAAQLQEGWGRILRMEFHDIDIQEDPYTLFSEKHAREIINFVIACNLPDSGITEILVHCRAGISRSAAIAFWISDRFGLSFPDEYSLYNKRIYKILLEEAMLDEFEGNRLNQG